MVLWKWNTYKNCKTQALDIKWYDQPRFKVNHCFQSKKKLENTENDNRDKRENHWFGERTNATQIASQSDEPWPLSRHICEHFSFVLGIFCLWAFVSGPRYLRALEPPPQTSPPTPTCQVCQNFFNWSNAQSNIFQDTIPSIMLDEVVLHLNNPHLDELQRNFNCFNPKWR